jgi:hypothetical protein
MLRTTILAGEQKKNQSASRKMQKQHSRCYGKVALQNSRFVQMLKV